MYVKYFHVLAIFFYYNFNFELGIAYTVCVGLVGSVVIVMTLVQLTDKFMEVLNVIKNITEVSINNKV
jgi:hypothetical protein